MTFYLLSRTHSWLTVRWADSDDTNYLLPQDNKENRSKIFLRTYHSSKRWHNMGKELRTLGALTNISKKKQSVWSFLVGRPGGGREWTCVLTGNMDFKTPEKRVSSGMWRVRKWKVHETVHQKWPLWGTDLRAYKERTLYNGQESEDYPDHVQPLRNLNNCKWITPPLWTVSLRENRKPPPRPDSSHLGQLK